MKYSLILIIMCLLNNTWAPILSSPYCSFLRASTTTLILGSQTITKPTYMLHFYKTVMIDVVPLPGQVFGAEGHIRYPITCEKILLPNIAIIKTCLKITDKGVIKTDKKLICTDFIELEPTEPFFQFMQLEDHEVKKYFQECAKSSIKK